jgi:hypothetical protein
MDNYSYYYTYLETLTLIIPITEIIGNRSGNSGRGIACGGSIRRITE